MPSTIPYDPSLVLSNIIDPLLLENVLAISAAQGPADAAQESLNSLISMRRSFDMTKMELMNLGIATDDLQKETDDLNAEITDAAKDYASKRIAAEKTIQPLRAKISEVHANIESPVDYLKTKTMQMALAADSLNMDVQFFTVDENNQSSDSFASTISGYVAATTDWLGSKVSLQMSRATAKQVSQQMENHDIQGTLVLSVSCTHKNATLLAPFAINVDKGIKVWNKMFPKDRLDANNYESMEKAAKQDGTENEASFSIISGMTFGSSFVGMVHVLNTTDTTISEKMSSVAGTIQAQLDAGAALEGASGGFGVNKSFGDDVKDLLSAQNVTSHVTLISMGVIPSIVANDVQLAVQSFTKFDPDSSMQAIATLSSATSADQTTLKTSADAARVGQGMVSMKGADIQSALAAVAPIQDASNKMLDINSMMTGLQDFLTKAATGDCGVPINYYLKSITKSMLAEMWIAKYIPGNYMTTSNDDVASASPAGGATGSTASVAAPPDASDSAPASS